MAHAQNKTLLSYLIKMYSTNFCQNAHFEIWPFLKTTFGVFIEWNWSHWKILMFDQVMGQNSPKNTNYSIYGLTDFPATQLFCDQSGWTQQTIIYRLVMTNHDFDVLMKKSHFWRDNGRGRHAGAKGSGASRPKQKVGPLGGTFGSIVISKTVFETSLSFANTWGSGDNGDNDANGDNEANC